VFQEETLREKGLCITLTSPQAKLTSRADDYEQKESMRKPVAVAREE